MERGLGFMVPCASSRVVEKDPLAVSNAYTWLIQPCAALDGWLMVRASAKNPYCGLRYLPIMLVTIYTQPIDRHDCNSTNENLFKLALHANIGCNCVIVATAYRHI